MNRHLANFGIAVLVSIVFATALYFAGIDFREIIATQNFWLGFLYMALNDIFNLEPRS